MLYLVCMTNLSPFLLCFSCYHVTSFSNHRLTSFISPLIATMFLLSRDIGEDMVIRASVQPLPICGYSFSKKNFLDTKLPRACPAHGQGWYPDEWRYSKRSMTPLTRRHGHMLSSNSSLRLSQDDAYVSSMYPPFQLSLSRKHILMAFCSLLCFRAVFLLTVWVIGWRA